MNKACVLSGAGNRFLLLDCFDGIEPPSPHELARRVCRLDPANEPQLRIDGLLLALPPRDGGDVQMVLYNADGSRPETCGNGLRCIGQWAWKQKSIEGDRVQVETDTGLRAVQLSRDSSAVHVHMGPVWVSEEAETIRVLGQDINLILANVGNPHGVLLVDDLIDAPVEQIGAALQVHSRFPEGLNVEFVRIDHAEAAVRVYERGVGETLACGSGACAVAVVLRAHTGRPWPIRVRMTGGVLEVTGDESDGVWLTGPVSEDALDEHSRRCLQDLLEA